jgi:nitrite reductase/ring-hydroxylating ferredoxin subunit
MSRLVRICAVAELQPGVRRVVEIDPYEEVLVLNIAGTVYAISNICAHEGAALQRGTIEGEVLYCPLHQWGFALSSGVCTHDSTLRARMYRVEISQGAWWLCLP